MLDQTVCTLFVGLRRIVLQDLIRTTYGTYIKFPPEVVLCPVCFTALRFCYLKKDRSLREKGNLSCLSDQAAYSPARAM